MDLSKAFDAVPHKRLMEKLKFYGINAQLLEWIENFLSAIENNESLLMDNHLNLLMLYLESNRAPFWDPSFSYLYE